MLEEPLLEQYPRDIFSDDFSYRQTHLTFDPPAIVCGMKKGAFTHGSFSFSAADGGILTGEVFSDYPRFRIETTSFRAKVPVIEYSLNSLGLEDGDSISGRVSVATNVGEFSITYTIKVIPESIKTSLGELKNLFHFTNIAKTNFSEAVKIFYSSSFVKVFWGYDSELLSSYRGFSKIILNEHNLDEFLVSAHKKTSCDISAELLNAGKIAQTLRLTKSGWGYIKISLRASSGFISFSKS